MEELIHQERTITTREELIVRRKTKLQERITTIQEIILLKERAVTIEVTAATTIPEIRITIMVIREDRITVTTKELLEEVIILLTIPVQAEDRQAALEKVRPAVLEGVHPVTREEVHLAGAQIRAVGRQAKEDKTQV